MKKFDSINVIPFIDIMLVLLAIVLTSATFVARGELEIAVPGSSSATPSEQQERVEIGIDENEQHYLDGQPIDFAELETELSEKPAETDILLRVDETVSFQRFIALIDVLNTQGLTQVSIQTRIEE